MDGRVKTLHPKLYAGLLARRDDPEHLRQAAENDIEFVDLVCVNLYPFERTAGRFGASDEEVIEDIDIGGPAMIRATAKNHAFTVVVVRPESYDAVLEELRESDGLLSLPTREWLAAEAFSYTARYDTAISRWFAEKSEEFPQLHLRAFEKVTELPYGENPHQRGAYYAQVGARAHVLSQVRQHHGKQISYNNILDLDAARTLLRDLGDEPACVIVKHNNPCGAAVAADLETAYRTAFECDPMSAFGGVIAVNRAGRPRHGAGADRAVRRGPVRAELRGRHARDARRQARRPAARGPGAPHPAARREGHPPGHRRPARPGPRHRRRGPRPDGRRDERGRRPSRSGPTSSSPGGSAATCARTRSCSPAAARPSASAPGR